MRPLVRIIVLWILIVSLPAQGIAAAITLPCTMMLTTHTQVAGPQTMDMDDCDDADMMQAMTQSKAQQGVGANVAHQNKPCGDDLHPKHSSCRACSAGYAGASAPPPFHVAEPFTAQFVNNNISPVSSFTGWIPSRIERPPRF